MAQTYQARFVQEGDSIDYTPVGAVSAGDVVVQGQLIGIATQDIGAGVQGALAAKGVFDLPKTAGSGTAITAGAKVYWDEDAEVAVTTSEGNIYLGKTVAAAADDDETVRVRLEQ